MWEAAGAHSERQGSSDSHSFPNKGFSLCESIRIHMTPLGTSAAYGATTTGSLPNAPCRQIHLCRSPKDQGLWSEIHLLSCRQIVGSLLLIRGDSVQAT